MLDRDDSPLPLLRGSGDRMLGCSAPWGRLALGITLPLLVCCTQAKDRSLDDLLDLGTAADSGTAADLRASGGYRVSVAVAGFGGGTITNPPGTIRCGGGNRMCAANYPAGTAVSLTATADPGSRFGTWTGACAGQGAVCTLSATADQLTTATFSLTCLPGALCWEAPLPFGYNLNSVAAISPTDVWAVGEAGVLLHYDGISWSLAPSGTTEDLADVWARATNDVWATARGPAAPL